MPPSTKDGRGVQKWNNEPKYTYIIYDEIEKFTFISPFWGTYTRQTFVPIDNEIAKMMRTSMVGTLKIYIIKFVQFVLLILGIIQSGRNTAKF